MTPEQTNAAPFLSSGLRERLASIAVRFEADLDKVSPWMRTAHAVELVETAARMAIEEAGSSDRQRVLDAFALRAPPVPAWYATSDVDRVFSWPYFYAAAVSAYRALTLHAPAIGSDPKVAAALKSFRDSITRSSGDARATEGGAPNQAPTAAPAERPTPAREPAPPEIRIAPDPVSVRAPVNVETPAVLVECLHCRRRGPVEEFEVAGVVSCQTCGSRQIRRVPSPEVQS